MAKVTIDLSTIPDRTVLVIVAKERPEFAKLLGEQIDRGWTDEEIIRLVAEAGGSGLAMRYTAKCLRAMRAPLANGEVFENK